MQKIHITYLFFCLSFLIITFSLQAGNSHYYQQPVGENEFPVDDQRKFDYYFYEAANASAMADYNSTYDYLNYCMHLDSTNATVIYELGNFYNSLGQKSRALTYLQKAVSFNQDNFYYKLSLANLYLELQQYASAIEVYESLLDKEPNKLDIYPYLSEAYRLEGDLPKAIESLDRFENILGLNEKISLQKFQLYTILDNKDKAYEEFLKYIQKYPREIKYYVLLGNLYIDDNRTDEAYTILTKAKELEPDNPYVIAAMAGYYEKTNQKDIAEKELYTALLSQRLDIETKLNILGQYISTLQYNEGNTERANTLFDTLIVEHPLETSLNLMYGNLLMLQNKPEEAQQQFRIFAESNPFNPVGWEQLLRSVPPDNIDESIEICKTAISYIPEEPLFYFYLAIGEYQKDEKREALQTLKDGVGRTTEQHSPVLISEFYGMIGSLYYDFNEGDSAFVAFEKSLEYYPQNLGVLNNYSYYLSLEKKDLNKAERMSSITIKAEPTNPTYLDTYGWILFEQGDYVTSKIYLENAVRYSESKDQEASKEVLEHYGDVLFKTGDIEKALEYWQKAREKAEEDDITLDKKIETRTYIEE